MSNVENPGSTPAQIDKCMAKTNCQLTYRATCRDSGQGVLQEGQVAQSQLVFVTER